MLAAPQVAGGLQIVHLANAGERVQAGDVVVEFDPSEQEYNLEQARSTLEEAEQEITKAKAEAAVQDAKDRVDLLKARFDVRRAELDVSRNELVSAIDAQKNNLALEEAKRRLAQLEQDVKSRAASSQATLAVSLEKRNKARLDMQQAQKNIENMKLKSPLDGLVSIKENWNATGGFGFFGMEIPLYREGDQVGSGSVVAEVLDVSNMEIQAKVSEDDRANINPGQPVQVLIDAFPGQTFNGKVKTVAGMAARGFFFDNSGMRKFDASFQLEKADPRYRPGVTSQIIVISTPVKDVLYLPRQAVFDKNGKPVVYVQTSGKFEARELKIERRTESQVVIEGLKEGTEVALVNPEEQTKDLRRAAGPIAPMAGGGAR
jgi:biotin carboxyl carrier protein